MRIELKCKCGAEAVFEDERGVFINRGGDRDEKGRCYVIEQRADDWQERHQQCLALGVEGRKP